MVPSGKPARSCPWRKRWRSAFPRARRGSATRTMWMRTASSRSFSRSHPWYAFSNLLRGDGYIVRRGVLSHIFTFKGCQFWCSASSHLISTYLVCLGLDDHKSQLPNQGLPRQSPPQKPLHQPVRAQFSCFSVGDLRMNINHSPYYARKKKHFFFVLCPIELDDGNIYRKPLYLMIKTHGFPVKIFPTKPIHWILAIL